MPAQTSTTATTEPTKTVRLYHAWLKTQPARTLCGRPRDPRVQGDPFDGSTHPDDCLVCDELVRAYIDGTWTP